MSAEERRKRLLWVALGIAAALFAWRELAPYVKGLGRGSGGIGAKMSRAPSPGAADLPQVVDLRLDELEKEPGHFSSQRDPFRFGVEKAPPPPPRVDESAMRQAMREAREKEQREVKPDLPPAPQPPPVDVTYLGSFGPANRKLAVFTNGSEIYNVFEGDQLNGKFYLVRIGLESADIGFVDFPEAPAQRLQVGG